MATLFKFDDFVTTKTWIPCAQQRHDQGF